MDYTRTEPFNKSKFLRYIHRSLFHKGIHQTMISNYMVWDREPLENAWFFKESQKLETPYIKPRRMEFYSSSSKLWNTAMFPTLHTTSPWCPLQAQDEPPAASQHHSSSSPSDHPLHGPMSSRGVPLRCGWYHSGRTAVPSVNIPIFLRGRKTLDPHNSDQVVTKDTKYCHLDNLFLQVHLGVQSLLPSHIFASQPI